MCTFDNAVELFEVLGDMYSCTVLAAVSAEPVEPQEIWTEFDISHSTVYRRLEELQKHGLVTEETYLDEKGNSYNVYHADFEEVVVEISDGEVELVVEEDEQEHRLNVVEYRG